MADFLFDRFGFDQTSKTVVHSTLAKQLIQTNLTGCQPYSDTKCSLIQQSDLSKIVMGLGTANQSGLSQHSVAFHLPK